MDIEELKKYSQNKIEADNLIKQIRQKIKETTWEKQNLREGFTETFKPLISQFEDPGEDSKKQNIFTQNQKMLQNQLALTEGIRANQKSITDGFSQFEKLAEMQKLGAIEDDEEEEEEEEDSEDDKDDQAQAPKKEKTAIVKLDLEKNFDDDDLATIQENNLIRPNDFYETNKEDFKKTLKKVTDGIKTLTSQINGRKNKKYPSEEYKSITHSYEKEKQSLSKYRNIMNDYITSLNYKMGEGLFFSPQELLRRFELLNGSLAAGNNGVLPEYIQVAHRLRDLGILSNKQLNKLLRKVI